MPEVELVLWDQIRNRKIMGMRFLRQYSIYSSVVDFYCPKLKLVIEIDGRYHTQQEIAESDKIRQKCIEELGINFMRFKNKEICEHLNKVLEDIKCKIIELKSQ